MSLTLQSVEADASQLPARERALLVLHLLAALDMEEDADVEELWLQEAERRYQLYRAGKISARPAADVFQDGRLHSWGRQPI